MLSGRKVKKELKKSYIEIVNNVYELVIFNWFIISKVMKLKYRLFFTKTCQRGHSLVIEMGGAKGMSRLILIRTISHSFFIDYDCDL